MLQRTRIKRASRQAQTLLPSFLESERNHLVAHHVENRLRPGTYVQFHKDIFITEIGYVTMAILPPYGEYLNEVVVVPGIDHLGTRGFMVIHSERAPFHSLAKTAEDALREASAAHAKADAIVAAFGSRTALKAAVRQVPWYTMSKVTDLENSGLCQWGAHSFLKRFGLYTLTYRIGLPRLMFQMSGAYGDRVTAATILRKQREQQTASALGFNDNPIGPTSKENKRDEPGSEQAG